MRWGISVYERAKMYNPALLAILLLAPDKTHMMQTE